jgi:hypothetical protein
VLCERKLGIAVNLMRYFEQLICQLVDARNDLLLIFFHQTSLTGLAAIVLRWVHNDFVAAIIEGDAWHTTTSC